ncbi:MULTISPECIES: preprotein translocase subunit TatA [Halorubrum]|uniref:preprotein translocase subunit TatA n=1 Tax=Halorubrum TaxID=56688 RepID=UPI000F8539F1|nr:MULTISPECIES: preprotein translocase subunit TatA [Halorubrum]AZQ13654.1 preprotein translocase subunit TatA [Halorubrum sp. PV6]
MVSVVPAFGGIPAGPELVIILLIAVLLFGVPLVVIAGAVLLFTLRSDGEGTDADRIAELEAEVERLREKVDDEPAERDEEDGL